MSVRVVGILMSISLLFGGLLPADAGEIQLVGRLDPFSGDNRYGDVWGEGNFAYIGSFQGSGVGIIDISDPTAPSLAAHYNASSGQFSDVKVENGIGYFASDNGGGVHVVDLSDPTSPRLLSQITSAIGGHNSVHNVSVTENFLYEATSRDTRIKVFDVSNAASPSFVRDIVSTDSLLIHDVTAIGDRLFASGVGGKTEIYDVSDIGTQAPTLLGSINSGRKSHSNWVSADGNTLASARETGGGGVRLYDISDPTNPILRSTITGASLGIDAISPHNPLIMGDLLFISWHQAGLQVLDISDPANPLPLGSFDTFPGPVNDFDGNWGVYPFLGLNRVLLSDQDGGLFVVDATTGVPEPSTLVLCAATAVCLLGYRWRRQRMAA